MNQLKRLWILPKPIDLMKIREQEIGEIIDFISKRSKNFTKPKIITIGGYGLRAFIPFSRYTRDCDFVLKKKDGWYLDQIKNWLPKDVSVEAFNKEQNHGFLRAIKPIKFQRRSIKLAMDFMEGQIRGRTQEEIIEIDDEFINNSTRTKLLIGDKEINLFVPSYLDYFILKVVSARPSDIRDIASLVWKNDIPSGIKKRIKKILPYPDIFHRNLKNQIIPDISDDRFIHSWHGTFISTEFTNNDKNEVIKKLNHLLYYYCSSQIPPSHPNAS